MQTHDANCANQQQPIENKPVANPLDLMSEYLTQDLKRDLEDIEHLKRVLAPNGASEKDLSRLQEIAQASKILMSQAEPDATAVAKMEEDIYSLKRELNIWLALPAFSATLHWQLDNCDTEPAAEG